MPSLHEEITAYVEQLMSDPCHSDSCAWPEDSCSCGVAERFHIARGLSYILAHHKSRTSIRLEVGGENYARGDREISRR